MIEHLNCFFSNKLSELRGLFAIIKLELKLAQISLLPLIVNLIMLVVIVSSTWLVLMILVFYLFILMGLSIILGLVCILGINFIALTGLAKYLNFNANNISFKYTRAYFSTKEN